MTQNDWQLLVDEPFECPAVIVPIKFSYIYIVDLKWLVHSFCFLNLRGIFFVSKQLFGDIFWKYLIKHYTNILSKLKLKYSTHPALFSIFLSMLVSIL